LLRRWLLRSNNITTRISAVSTSALLRRVRAPRIGKFLLLPLLPLPLLLVPRDLLAGIQLLILQQQLPRKLLVQLGLFGLGGVCVARGGTALWDFGRGDT